MPKLYKTDNCTKLFIFIFICAFMSTWVNWRNEITKNEKKKSCYASCLTHSAHRTTPKFTKRNRAICQTHITHGISEQLQNCSLRTTTPTSTTTTITSRTITPTTTADTTIPQYHQESDSHKRDGGKAHRHRLCLKTMN